jgi:chloride channel protein, CIC family
MKALWQRLVAGVRGDEAQRFFLLSVLIGVCAGLLIVCFHNLIELVSWAVLGLPAGSRTWGTLLGPMGGAVISTLLVLRVFKAARGSGVVQTKVAVAQPEGEIPASGVAGKLVACSISIGSGNALGPEDPSLHMGAGVASVVGRAFKLPREQMRLIPPVGAAAGIAAAFNTPIMAVLFVIEEVIGAWNAMALGSVVLASVSAVVTSRYFLGDNPLFHVPPFDIMHPSEMAVFAVIGLAAGLLATLFTRTIIAIRSRIQAMADTRLTLVKPALAGLLVGLIGLWLPEILGAGYGPVDGALHGRYAWQALIAIGLLKMLATTACFSAGVPGGMFAPTLFIGAMVGGGLGGLARLFWPMPISPDSVFVLVGMGAFFAGVFRAPMTSVFMVFEVSASYKIIAPVMVANMLAYLISRRLQQAPFFDRIAGFEGIHLDSQEDIREQRAWRVEDAMLDPSEAARHRLIWCGARRWRTEPVAGDPGEAVPCLYSDQTLETALPLLATHGAAPVVDRRNESRLLGVLTLDAALARYGITRNAESPPA